MNPNSVVERDLTNANQSRRVVLTDDCLFVSGHLERSINEVRDILIANSDRVRVVELKSLRLGSHETFLEFLQLLLGCKNLRRFSILMISDVEFNLNHVWIFCNKFIPNCELHTLELETMNVVSSHWGDRFVAALCQQSSITRLNLAYNRITSEGLDLLRDRGALQGVRTMDVRGNPLQAYSLCRLLKSSPVLTDIDVSFCHFDQIGRRFDLDGFLEIGITLCEDNLYQRFSSWNRSTDKYGRSGATTVLFDALQHSFALGIPRSSRFDDERRILEVTVFLWITSRKGSQVPKYLLRLPRDIRKVICKWIVGDLLFQ